MATLIPISPVHPQVVLQTITTIRPTTIVRPTTMALLPLTIQPLHQPEQYPGQDQRLLLQANVPPDIIG